MTLTELAEACDDATRFKRFTGEDPELATVILAIPGRYKTKRVEILPGCFGENLGLVPIGPKFGAGAKLNGTQVSVKVSAIRKYIESLL